MVAWDISRVRSKLVQLWGVCVFCRANSHAVRKIPHELAQYRNRPSGFLYLDVYRFIMIYIPASSITQMEVTFCPGKGHLKPPKRRKGGRTWYALCFLMCFEFFWKAKGPVVLTSVRILRVGGMVQNGWTSEPQTLIQLFNPLMF